MGGDTVGNINYFSSSTDGCPPWLITFSIPTAVRSNFTQTPVQVPIYDLRGKENSVNLDTNGLEILKYNGFIQGEFEDGSEVQKSCFEEISDILKKRLGASRVLIYHYTFRARGAPRTDGQCDETHRNPAFYPHIDMAPVGVGKLLENHFDKSEIEKVKKNRIQVINVWRPLGSHPITQKPLAICDYRSVNVNQDVLPLTIRGAGVHENAYTLSRSAQDAHIWYYLSQMRSDEMFVFKIFDSKPDIAQFGFHTAFQNDNESSSNNEQQLSLELRCLVLYDE